MGFTMKKDVLLEFVEEALPSESPNRISVMSYKGALEICIEGDDLQCDSSVLFTKEQELMLLTRLLQRHPSSNYPMGGKNYIDSDGVNCTGIQRMEKVETLRKKWAALESRLLDRDINLKLILEDLTIKYGG